MMQSLALALFLASAPPPASGNAGLPPLPWVYAYQAAVVDVPAGQDVPKVLAAWSKMTLERKLETHPVDAPAGVALGNWMERPHVCQGRVRYHAVVVAASRLKVVLVAECYGVDVSLGRAVVGLAQEFSTRLGGTGDAMLLPLDGVPPRLWELRMRRPPNVPPGMEPPPPVVDAGQPKDASSDVDASSSP